MHLIYALGCCLFRVGVKISAFEVRNKEKEITMTRYLSASRLQFEEFFHRFFDIQMMYGDIRNVLVPRDCKGVDERQS